MLFTGPSKTLPHKKDSGVRFHSFYNSYKRINIKYTDYKKTMKQILFDKTESVATIRINRPRYNNALNLEVLDEMTDLTRRVANDPAINGLIITGSGDSFCAGGDLSYIREFNQSKDKAIGALTNSLHRLLLDLRQLPKPVISAVNGIAAGAGITLCMACDLKIAAANAYFKQAYTSIGLVPDGGWNVLVARQIGATRTSELLLLDELFSADVALKFGLINRITEPEELMNTCSDLASKAAGRMGSFARSKALLNLALYENLEYLMECERKAIMAASKEETFKIALDQFLK